MLEENNGILRQEKGMTQETQPDASSLAEVADGLAAINEQLALQAIRKKKLTRRVLICLPLSFILMIVMCVICVYYIKVKPRQNAVLTTTHIVCTLNGETYSYGVTYDENCQIREAGGDTFIADHVSTEQYDDANILLAHIEDYFVDHGGTYQVVEQTE